ncbi:MAG: hypothetical protein ACLQJ7_16000 [Syntrophobacteraceae bacterium]
MAKKRKSSKNKKGGKGLNADAPFVKLCLAPVKEDEFLFYSHLAISAGQLQTQVTSPTEYGVNLLEEEEGRISRISFTDNPYNRVMVALIENLGEEERQEKMPAISTRIFALMNLLNQGKLKQWTKPCADDGSILLSETVFRAAARATVDINLKFVWKEFEQIVEEILRLESEHEAQNGDCD